MERHFLGEGQHNHRLLSCQRACSFRSIIVLHGLLILLLFLCPPHPRDLPSVVARSQACNMIWSGQTSHCSWLNSLKGVAWKRRRTIRGGVTEIMFHHNCWVCFSVNLDSWRHAFNSTSYSIFSLVTAVNVPNITKSRQVTNLIKTCRYTTVKSK